MSIRPDDDFYETPEDVTLSLLANLEIPDDVFLWEVACGNGAISKLLPNQDRVLSTELIEGRYGVGGINFLKLQESLFPKEAKFWVISNPPYKDTADFVRKAFELGAEKVIFFLSYSFGESATKRNDILDDGRLYMNLLYKERITMYPANYIGCKKGTSNTAYAWFIWTKEPLREPSHWVTKRISRHERKK